MMKLIRRLSPCLLLVAQLGLSACASTAMRSLDDTVDPNVVKYFPQEGRRWTYEAENEVIISLDRMDSARDHVEELEIKISDMDDTFGVIDERGGQGREVAEARLDWLETCREHAYQELSAAEINVLCSRARLELTKAQLAVRFDLPVEEDFVEPFEEQHRACEEDLADAKMEAEELFQLTLKAKDNWRSVRSTYAQKSGDYNHGLWID